MPNMADIVIKKADGTTNQTFVAKSPAAGDKNPAVWTLDGYSTTRAHRPVYQVTAMSNGPKTARRVNLNLNWPVVRTVDGQPMIAHRCSSATSTLVPQELTDPEILEFAHAQGNLLTAAIIRDCISSGYAPN